MWLVIRLKRYRTPKSWSLALRGLESPKSCSLAPSDVELLQEHAPQAAGGVLPTLLSRGFFVRLNRAGKVLWLRNTPTEAAQLRMGRTQWQHRELVMMSWQSLWRRRRGGTTHFDTDILRISAFATQYQFKL